MSSVSKDNYLLQKELPREFNEAVLKLDISRALRAEVDTVLNGTKAANLAPFRMKPSAHVFRALAVSYDCEVVEVLARGVNAFKHPDMVSAQEFINDHKAPLHLGRNVYCRVTRVGPIVEQAFYAIENGGIYVRRPKNFDPISGAIAPALEEKPVDKTDALLAELGITGPVEAKPTQTKGKKRKKREDPEDFREAKVAPHRRKSLTFMKPDEYVTMLLRD